MLRYGPVVLILIVEMLATGARVVVVKKAVATKSTEAARKEVGAWHLQVGQRRR